jgi:hypothetical protein
MTTKSTPRGVRNNNPGNIEWGDPWQGLVPLAQRTDSRFAQFTTPAYGIRAIARLLITYYDKHKIDTVRGAINRWAPPGENQTTAYVASVASLMGVDPDQPLDFHDFTTLKGLVEGIIRHENGSGPEATPNTWYSARTVDDGLKLAGVVPPVATVPKTKVPVTKETVGATVAAGTGVGQLIDVMPAVADALARSKTDLTSGEWARIAFAVATIAISVYIAWSQYRKNREGVL